MIPQSAYDALRSTWDKLHNERAELVRRMDEIDAQIVELMAAFVAHYGSELPAMTPANDVLTTSVRTFAPRPGISSVKEIQRAAIEVLEQHGGPMHRREIYDAITARGLRVGGADTIRNFVAHLSHDPRLRPVKDKKGYWMLHKWEIQENPETARLPMGTAA
jgi:hypothetical protein